MEKNSASHTAEEESASRTEQESATQTEESASWMEEGMEEESTSLMEEGMKQSALDKTVSSDTLPRSKNPASHHLFSTAYKAPKSVSASKITDRPDSPQ